MRPWTLYSLDTVCQNTVHAKLCGYPPLTNATIVIKWFIIKLFLQNLRLYFIIWITSGCIKYFFHSILRFNFVELMVFFITFLFTENTISPIRSGSNTIWTYNCTTWFTIGHFFCCLFVCKTRNILFTGIWFAKRPMIFHHKTFRYNMNKWRHLFY
jgi:hypothetical protein